MYLVLHEMETNGGKPGHVKGNNTKNQQKEKGDVWNLADMVYCEVKKDRLHHANDEYT